MAESIFNRASQLLRDGLPVGSDVMDIQIALKLLGFMPNNYLKQVDGKMGKSTLMAIKALNWAIFERENDSTVPYDKITDLLLNKYVEWFKVPFVENPEEENEKIQTFLKNKKDYIINTYCVPFDFIYAILWQETELRHYDPDGFLFVGCDTGKTEDYKYRSRGWGMGQDTIQNHPPDIGQQENIVDPVRNIEFTCNHLRLKFKTYCAKFRICQYPTSDNRYLRDCKQCIWLSPRADIQLPDAKYHSKARIGYKDMPIFTTCGWGLATKRYNGDGSDADAYKYEVLSKIEGKEIR